MLLKKGKIMKFKAKLRILDKANELMNKQVWAAAQCCQLKN